MRYSIFSLIFLAFVACNSPESKVPQAESRVDVDALKTVLTSEENSASSADVNGYWDQGKAELNHFKVIQNRYRELHEGEAILVFVKEDFLYQEQVKNDYYRNPNSTPTLKTNKILRFPTGLYDYSLMTSVFTPVDAQAFPYSLKVSHTAQDWCGQGYLQLNRKDEAYQFSSFSYFESEGDEIKSVKENLLEDELFNRIRLNPQALPSGKVSMIPSADVIRLLHLPLKGFDAEIQGGDYKGKDFEGDKLKSLKVSYAQLGRELEIVYKAEAPYEIMGWKDTYPSVFDRKPRTTLAKRTDKLFTDYWSKNKLGDQSMRKDFGLETYLTK